jgi:hypothetical protein
MPKMRIEISNDTTGEVIRTLIFEGEFEATDGDGEPGETHAAQFVVDGLDFLDRYKLRDV